MGGLPFRVFEGSAVFLLAVLAGCGGRSSTLEDETLTGAGASQSVGGSSGSASSGPGGTAAHGNVSASGAATGEGGRPGAGATGGGATGGTPSSGAASGGVGTAAAPSGGTASGGAAGVGTAGTPSGGAAAGGTTGITPFNYKTCVDYCSTTAQGACPSNVSPDECIRSCVSEVGAQSPSCQKNAEGLLTCITKAYQNSSSCSQFDQLAGAKCSALSDKYQRCVGTGTPPVITPPEPACSSSGSSSNGTCSLSVKCTNGAFYDVACSQTSPASSDCTCTANLPTGAATQAGFGLNESTTFACYDSLVTCGFPQIGAK